MDTKNKSCIPVYNSIVGEKGDKGDTGSRGTTGEAGKDGVGIVDITSERDSENKGSIIHIILSNGNKFDVSVKDGKDGTSKAITSDELKSVLKDSNLQNSIANAVEAAIYQPIFDVMNGDFTDIKHRIEDVSSRTEELSSKVEGTSIAVEQLSGYTTNADKVLDGLSSQIDSIKAQNSNLSTSADTMSSKVSAIESNLSKTSEDVSKALKESTEALSTAQSTRDSINNIIENGQDYQNRLKELESGITGNGAIALGDVKKAVDNAKSLGLLGGSNSVGQSIIDSINKDESTDKISASKIDISDNSDIFNGLKKVDVVLNNGNSAFYGSGSGNIAAGTISWDSNGNTKLNIDGNPNNSLKVLGRYSHDGITGGATSQNNITSGISDNFGLMLKECANVMVISADLSSVFNGFYLPYAIYYNNTSSYCRTTIYRPSSGTITLAEMSQYVGKRVIIVNKSGTSIVIGAGKYRCDEQGNVSESSTNITLENGEVLNMVFMSTKYGYCWNVKGPYKYIENVYANAGTYWPTA